MIRLIKVSVVFVYLAFTVLFSNHSVEHEHAADIGQCSICYAQFVNVLDLTSTASLMIFIERQSEDYNSFQKQTLLFFAPQFFKLNNGPPIFS
jgi:hypothetical protein